MENKKRPTRETDGVEVDNQRGGFEEVPQVVGEGVATVIQMFTD